MFKLFKKTKKSSTLSDTEIQEILYSNDLKPDGRTTEMDIKLAKDAHKALNDSGINDELIGCLITPEIPTLTEAEKKEYFPGYSDEEIEQIIRGANNLATRLLYPEKYYGRAL